MKCVRILRVEPESLVAIRNRFIVLALVRIAVIEGHRQNVMYESDLAADDFDADLRANDDQA